MDSQIGPQPNVSGARGSEREIKFEGLNGSPVGVLQHNLAGERTEQLGPRAEALSTCSGAISETRLKEYPLFSKLAKPRSDTVVTQSSSTEAGDVCLTSLPVAVLATEFSTALRQLSPLHASGEADEAILGPLTEACGHGSKPGRTLSHWLPAEAARTGCRKRGGFASSKGESRDPEVEIVGADKRAKRRATEDDRREGHGRRQDSSSRARTGAGIKILADLTPRRGPLAPGSTRVSPPRFRRSVAKPGRTLSHWLPAKAARTGHHKRGGSARSKRERESRDPEVEIVGADRRAKRRATEDGGREGHGRCQDSSSRARTGAGIKILADPTPRRGPLAPGSTRMSPPRFRRSVAKPGMGFRDREKGAGGGKEKGDTMGTAPRA
ncbi:hypothetical protein NDU88_005088 [Pleurodeles waltl]|uniref:Uncharacterized protein n=1 Tax=Pleurodeles waltl TaxID=8319 RepID=A0AAV7LLV6_PLEWA|nr:hypothetical protein NDU88_005088 [Pleurodeles waltl]